MEKTELALLIAEHNKRLDKDIAKAIKAGHVTSNITDLRPVVDAYYSAQKDRIKASNRCFALKTDGTSVADLILLEYQGLEQRAKKWAELILKSSEDPVCDWAMGIQGIGPIFAATLKAYLDIELAPTVGHIWSFCGLDPNRKWHSSKEADKIAREAMDGKKKVTDEIMEKAAEVSGWRVHVLEKMFKDYKKTTGGSDLQCLTNTICRRPWNNKLKTTCYLIGEAFMKLGTKKNSSFARMYRLRKIQEQGNNKKKVFKKQADDMLKRSQSKEWKKVLKEGMLPPGIIDRRARRYAVKMFLSCWHEVAFTAHHGEPPPNPYPIAILGHGHQVHAKDVV